MFKGGETHGACVWHVKQANNGTSWLCAERPYEFPGLTELVGNEWTKINLDGKLIGVSQPQGTLGVDGFASFALPVQTQSKREYTATLDVGDRNGNKAFRVITLIDT